MIRLLLTATVWLGCAGLAAARPADDRAAAAEVARRAEAHFAAGEYADAARDYRAAYRRFPAAGLLYNLAQSYRLLGACAPATATYRRYLEAAPRSPYRALVRRHLAGLAPCTRAELARRARPHRTRRLAGAVTAGLGLVVGGLGVRFALVAQRDAEEVARRSRQGEPWDDVAPIDARGHRAALLGGALLGAGVLATIAGAALWALGWHDGDDGPPLTVAPRAGGVEVEVAWRF